MCCGIKDEKKDMDRRRFAAHSKKAVYTDISLYLCRKEKQEWKRTRT